MSYKKLFFAIILFLLSLKGVTQSPPKNIPYYFELTKSPFLDQIFSFKELEFKMELQNSDRIIPTDSTVVNVNHQLLIKTKNNVYVLIQQTGFVYRLEKSADSSSYIGKRIDGTINLNYNIGCNFFEYKEKLYSYGGYGFWKSNGLLRGFDFLDRQWNIIPTNVEIMSSDFNWFSKKEGRIYVIYQSIINGGIKDVDYYPGKKIYDSYYLDLKTSNWNKLGTLNENLIELFNKNPSPTNIFEFENGLVCLLNDQAYAFDFEHNKVYRAKHSDYNQFIMRRINLKGIFYSKNNLYLYSPDHQVFDLQKFDLSDYELVGYSIWGMDPVMYNYAIGALVFILFIVLILLIIKRIIKNKIKHSQLQAFKNKASGQVYIGTELSLIELLLNSALKNSTVEIHEINHVLGLKDKNVGLQKKVRSDVINSINDKYQMLTGNLPPLIISIRKQDDKRFLEYFIADTEIKMIQKLIQDKG